MSDQDIIQRLASVLEERKSADAGQSYVASLYARGLNKILEKVGEEAVETILAAKDAANATDDSGETPEVIKETADLWFHTLVMLSYLDQSPVDLLAELERRFGTSGIEEKAARAK